MLKRKEPGTRTRWIAADAPVVFAATGWSEPVPGRELHPLESSAFHGALLRQPVVVSEVPITRPASSR
jgi:hypothetical protein